MIKISRIVKLAKFPSRAKQLTVIYFVEVKKHILAKITVFREYLRIFALFSRLWEYFASFLLFLSWKKNFSLNFRLAKDFFRKIFKNKIFDSIFVLKKKSFSPNFWKQKIFAPFLSWKEHFPMNFWEIKFFTQFSPRKRNFFRWIFEKRNFITYFLKNRNF